MYYKKIVGENIYLSPMDVDHETDILTSWLNEDEAIAYNSAFYGRLMGKKETEELLCQWSKGPYSFSIVSLDDNTFIGHISLFNISPNEQNATMGINIGKKFCHKGYGTEAIRLLIQYAFHVRRFTALHLEVYSFNENAYNLYKKLGFVECGRWHKSIYHLGTYHDIILMELIK